ncbi:hypothetical protein XHC_2087 [Xanthomonas hortorum pv. carotae str. M081]|nr:hypothetical protein XHC_2087 [Xanthomonas hortorum pv. carotae str. M081]
MAGGTIGDLHVHSLGITKRCRGGGSAWVRWIRRG